MQEPHYSEALEFTGETLQQCLEECNRYCREFQILITSMCSLKETLTSKTIAPILGGSTIPINTPTSYTQYKLIISHTIMRNI